MDEDFYNWCLQRLEYLQNVVDPIVITSELVKVEILTEGERRFIFRLKDRRDLWYRLLTILKPRCPFGRFLDALEECGYKIRMNRDQLEAPDRTNCQNSSRKFAQRLLVNLKMQTHNAVFANPRDYLHKLSFKYYEKFMKEKDEYRKQMIADRYASVICAEIDSYIMLFKENETTMTKIRKLKALIPHTTNSCVTNVAYNARMAIASSVAGKFDDAENFLQSSKMDSFNLQACVEVENMLYIEVFSLLSKYEKEPSIELRDRILIISDNGLQFLEDEDEFSRLFWRRMFLIRMTYCLFGLSMKFQRIPGCYIDQDAIHRGKRYLAEIDKCWDGIESRRKIWYYVARARQYELECDLSSMEPAIWFVDQAINLASIGNFSEKVFAIDYKNGLLSQKENLEENENIRNEMSIFKSDFSSEGACETDDRSSDPKIGETSWEPHDFEIDENEDPEICDNYNKSLRWDLHDTDSTFFNKKTKSYLESLVQDTKGSESILYSLERSIVDMDILKSDSDRYSSWRKVDNLGCIEHDDSDEVDSMHFSPERHLDGSLYSNVATTKYGNRFPTENESISINSLPFDSIAFSKDKNHNFTQTDCRRMLQSSVDGSMTSACDNSPVENSFDLDSEYLKLKLHNIKCDIKSIFSHKFLDQEVQYTLEYESNSNIPNYEMEFKIEQRTGSREPIEHSVELSSGIGDLSVSSLVFDQSISFSSSLNL